MSKTLQVPALIEQSALILIAAGSSPAEAHTVASNLVMANLSGHDSHGVGMLPRYVDAVLEGGLTPNASVKTNLDIGTMLSLDGQRGYGQVVGEQAMQLGMARAKQHGSCIMMLGNAHHLGRIGHFAEMAVAQGLVSLHFVNVLSRPVVAPWGGGDAALVPTPAALGCRSKDKILLFSTLQRAASPKARCVWPTTRAFKSSPAHSSTNMAAPLPSPAWWWCHKAMVCLAR